MILASILTANSPAGRLDELGAYRRAVACHLRCGDARGEWRSDEARWSGLAYTMEASDWLAMLTYMAAGITLADLMAVAEAKDTPEIIAQREADVAARVAREAESARLKAEMDAIYERARG